MCAWPKIDKMFPIFCQISSKTKEIDTNFAYLLLNKSGNFLQQFSCNPSSSPSLHLHFIPHPLSVGKPLLPTFFPFPLSPLSIPIPIPPAFPFTLF